MDDFQDILTVFDGGVRLAVKAKPGAKGARAPRLADVGEGKRAVEIAVAAQPEDGKANKAILARLADEIGLKKAALEVKTGASGRLKIVEIRGNPALLRARVAAWLEAMKGG